MRANLVEQELVGSILSAFYEVYNYFDGYGLNETVFANALAWELTLRGHRVTREATVDVSYKGHRVGKQRLDMVVDEAVLVESKAMERLPPSAARQLLNYLRVSPYRVGLLLHFGPRPYFKKLVNTPKERAVSVRTRRGNPAPRDVGHASLDEPDSVRGP